MSCFLTVTIQTTTQPQHNLSTVVGGQSPQNYAVAFIGDDWAGLACFFAFSYVNICILMSHTDIWIFLR